MCAEALWTLCGDQKHSLDYLSELSAENDTQEIIDVDFSLYAGKFYGYLSSVFFFIIFKLF